MSEQTWIEEQKKNRLFRQDLSSNDAAKMLDFTDLNRLTSSGQAKTFVAANLISSALNVKVYSNLVSEASRIQGTINDHNRLQFMKVAIEQWQGKLANMKTRLQDALL